MALLSTDHRNIYIHRLALLGPTSLNVHCAFLHLTSKFSQQYVLFQAHHHYAALVELCTSAAHPRKSQSRAQCRGCETPPLTLLSPSSNLRASTQMENQTDQVLQWLAEPNAIVSP